MATFTLYLRGRLVRVSGHYEEPHRDYQVAPIFCVEDVSVADEGPAMVMHTLGCNGLVDWLQGSDSLLESTITDGEWKEIQKAWEALP